MGSLTGRFSRDRPGCLFKRHIMEDIKPKRMLVILAHPDN
jgi:hypothetical protein